MWSLDSTLGDISGFLAARTQAYEEDGGNTLAKNGAIDFRSCCIR